MVLLEGRDAVGNISEASGLVRMMSGVDLMAAAFDARMGSMASKTALDDRISSVHR